MRACRLTIKNFRGVKSATLHWPQHGVLIGDNNTGKTTILEALDLVLGPDRLNRQPPIDEHDFFRGAYLPEPATPAAEAAEAVDDNRSNHSLVSTLQATSFSTHQGTSVMLGKHPAGPRTAGQRSVRWLRLSGAGSFAQRP